MLKVGCCGYPTSMKRYFETFSLVELNRTFHELLKPLASKSYANVDDVLNAIEQAG